MHLQRRRDHHLRREHQRSQRRRRCDGAIVIGVAQARAAGTVVAELALLAVVDLIGALRPVAGGQAPDVLAVVLPAHRVLDRIGALGQCRATAVLVLLDAPRALVAILYAPEIDPALPAPVS